MSFRARWSLSLQFPPPPPTSPSVPSAPPTASVASPAAPPCRRRCARQAAAAVCVRAARAGVATGPTQKRRGDADENCPRDKFAKHLYGLNFRDRRPLALSGASPLPTSSSGVFKRT